MEDEEEEVMAMLPAFREVSSGKKEEAS